jgi:rod shape-determining protein MreD
MIVAVFLMVDLMFQRPPGLRALAVLLATEFLRRQAPAMRAATFAAEWATIAATFAAAALAERLVLVLFFVSRPGPGVALLELVMTVLAYPLVVVVTNLVFRVTKILPGESGLLGQRP